MEEEHGRFWVLADDGDGGSEVPKVASNATPSAGEGPPPERSRSKPEASSTEGLVAAGSK